MAGANRKAKRAKKTSQGIHGGGGKVRLTPIQKALLGGGQVRRFVPIGAEPSTQRGKTESDRKAGVAA